MSHIGSFNVDWNTSTNKNWQRVGEGEELVHRFGAALVAQRCLLCLLPPWVCCGACWVHLAPHQSGGPAGERAERACRALRLLRTSLCTTTSAWRSHPLLMDCCSCLLVCLLDWLTPRGLAPTPPPAVVSCRKDANTRQLLQLRSGIPACPDSCACCCARCAEALQPGGYLMSMLSQQPFMPMVPAAMMMAGGGQGPAAGGGGRPMMVPMVGQHPFFSMIGCPPGGVMALCGAGAGSTSSAAGRKSGKRGATAGGGFGVAAGGLGSMPFVIVPGTGMGGGGMMQLPCMPGMQMHMHMPGVQVMHAGVPGGMMHMPMVQPH